MLQVLQGLKSSVKADIYSFGVVLWEIVCKESPKRGQMRDPKVGIVGVLVSPIAVDACVPLKVLLHRQRRTFGCGWCLSQIQPSHAPQVPEECPPEIDALINAMMAQQPHDRPT